jgi:hypothetical protein
VPIVFAIRGCGEAERVHVIGQSRIDDWAGQIGMRRNCEVNPGIRGQAGFHAFVGMLPGECRGKRFGFCAGFEQLCLRSSNRGARRPQASDPGFSAWRGVKSQFSLTSTLVPPTTPRHKARLWRFPEQRVANASRKCLEMPLLALSSRRSGFPNRGAAGVA